MTKIRNALAWAWQDIRDDWGQLDGGKVMAGLLIYPILLGVVWEALRALHLIKG